jgi:hypothetical protein
VQVSCRWKRGGGPSYINCCHSVDKGETTLTPPELLLHVFCLEDDELQAVNLECPRQRGPQPQLADSEVLTMELVGKFRRLGTDKDLFHHFRCYHRAAFPALAYIYRTGCRNAQVSWLGPGVTLRFTT